MSQAEHSIDNGHRGSTEYRWGFVTGLRMRTNHCGLGYSQDLVGAQGIWAGSEDRGTSERQRFFLLCIFSTASDAVCDARGRQRMRPCRPVWTQPHELAHMDLPWGLYPCGPAYRDLPWGPYLCGPTCMDLPLYTCPCGHTIGTLSM